MNSSILGSCSRAKKLRSACERGHPVYRVNRVLNDNETKELLVTMHTQISVASIVNGKTLIIAK